jgi:hypothetical protein
MEFFCHLTLQVNYGNCFDIRASSNEAHLFLGDEKAHSNLIWIWVLLLIETHLLSEKRQKKNMAYQVGPLFLALATSKARILCLDSL